ncbi:MAG: class I SAM-dependent methyltransferase [Proteobacteria bacterium]|nr:class I SAM-dependent methyltransferase [Pseudomonadota bacterium]
MTTPAFGDVVTDDIRRAYDAVDYDYASYPQTHPDRIATVAALFGVDTPPLATARVLEVGCGTGANILPIAARWPESRVVGFDLAPRPVDAGRAIIRDLGLTNIDLRVADLRELPAELGDFDYIIAHGFYSWVPDPVRDALLALIASRLSPQGVAMVSYNALPGSRVRQIGWDAMNFRTRNTTDAAARLRQAREILALMAEQGTSQSPRDSALRAELGESATRTDSALMHDDMAVPNEPFYFHEFMARAAGHGLNYLGDTDVRMMTPSGLSPNVRKFITRFDRLEAEQYLDFARLRRFRNTLLTRAGSTTNFAMQTSRVRAMQVAIASPLVQSMEEAEHAGKPRDSVLAPLDPSVAALARWLIARAPQTASFAEIAAWRNQHTPTDPRTPEALVSGMYVAGVVALYTDPAPVVSIAGPRPAVLPFVRRLAESQHLVPNQRHEAVNLHDPAMRTLVRLMDGTRDHAALLAGLGPSYPHGKEGLDAALRFFARVGLLVG